MTSPAYEYDCVGYKCLRVANSVEMYRMARVKLKKKMVYLNNISC